MPSLKDIRGRIGSVRNIAQITRAMEMVAASRMKRAQDAILAARPYSDELRDALSRVAAVVGEEIDPLLARRPVRARRADHDHDRPRPGGIAERERHPRRRCAGRRSAGAPRNGDGRVEIEAITVGRKGRDGLRRAGIPIAAHFTQLGDRPAFTDVTPIARLVTEDFLEEKYDEIHVATALHQHPDPAAGDHAAAPDPSAGAGRGPGGGERRVHLRAIARGGALAGCCRTSLPSTCIGPCSRTRPPSRARGWSRCATRPTMPHELIEDLTLVYNKTRQATITREMIEIASGAEALGG